MNSIAGKFQAKGRRALLTAVIASLALSACNNEPDETAQASSLLAPVPADTPYLMASLSHLPDDVFEFQMKKFAPALSSMLKVLLEQTAKSLADQPEEVAKGSAVFGMLTDYLDNPDRWEQVRYVIYSNELFPVFRAELPDPQKSLSELEQLHSHLGHTPVRTAGVKGDIFEVPLSHGELTAYYGVEGNYFVATLLPVSEKANLSKALGQTAPAQAYPLASLEQLAQKRGYEKNSLGFIDTLKVFDTVFDTNSSFNHWLMAASADHDKADLSNITPVCRQELRDLVAIAPYLDAGLTRSDKIGYSFDEYIQLRPDIAQGIQSFTGDIAGLDQDPGGELALAASFQIGPMRDFMLQMARNVEAAPYQCEELLDLNQAAEQLISQAGTPIPPFAGQVRGFKFRMDGLEDLIMATQSGEQIEPRMTTTLFVENAQLLLSMAQLFMPTLAEVELPKDGTPQRLEDIIPPGLAGPGDVELYAALTESALGISIGPNQVESLQPMMQEGSGKTGILGSYWFDYQIYARFLQSVVDDVDTDIDSEDLAFSEDGDLLSEDELSEKLEAARQRKAEGQEFLRAFSSFYEVLGRSGLWVQPQTDSLLIHQEVEFK